jgi:hypothetical protein
MAIDVSAVSAIAAALALIISAIGKAAAMVIWAWRHR